MSFRQYNKSAPEVLAANARKGKLTAIEKEARLQARIDAIVEQATHRLSTGQEYCAGDVLFDRRPLMAKLGKKAGNCRGERI